jgi:hypothetical protein
MVSRICILTVTRMSEMITYVSDISGCIWSAYGKDDGAVVDGYEPEAAALLQERQKKR